MFNYSWKNARYDIIIMYEKLGVNKIFLVISVDFIFSHLSSDVNSQFLYKINMSFNGVLIFTSHNFTFVRYKFLPS